MKISITEDNQNMHNMFILQPGVSDLYNEFDIFKVKNANQHQTNGTNWTQLTVSSDI